MEHTLITGYPLHATRGDSSVATPVAPTAPMGRDGRILTHVEALRPTSLECEHIPIARPPTKHGQADGISGVKQEYILRDGRKGVAIASSQCESVAGGCVAREHKVIERCNTTLATIHGTMEALKHRNPSLDPVMQRQMQMVENVVVDRKLLAEQVIAQSTTSAHIRKLPAQFESTAGRAELT